MDTQVAGRGVEVRGVEYVPLEERHSVPPNLTWVWIGAQMTFGIIILGWLPITVGLSWWGSVTSMTLGLLVGATLFGLFSRFGPRTGTNSAVSSGAHFGIHGRLIASALAVFIAVGYAALNVWVTGDMVAAGVDHVFGTGFTDGARAIWYAIIAATMITVALYGHNLVVAMQKIVTPLMLIVLAVVVVTTAGDFDPTFNEGAETAFGGFWPTWLFSFFVAAQLPISYTPFANQFSRYINSEKWSDRQVFWAASIGMFAGCWVAFIFGAYIATFFGPDTVSFGDGVVRATPGWFVVPLVIAGLLGSFGQGSLALYGSGLDASSLVPKLRRIPATVILSIIALGLVFTGAFVWNVVDTVNYFVVILAVMVVPWMVICLFGYARTKGRYWPYDLQAFEADTHRGAYWYAGGFNLRAVVVYVAGVLAALMFVSTGIYTGPLAVLVGGADISAAVAAVVTVILYPIAMMLFPRDELLPAPGEKSLSSPLLNP